MLGFINAPVDRGAQFRGNSDWICKRLQDPQTRILLFVGDRPVIDVSGETPEIVYMSPAQVSRYCDLKEAVLLNATQEQDAVFAVQIEARHQDFFDQDPTRLIDLRSLAMQAVLAPAETGRLAQARSVLSWHENHRFCAGCGKATQFCDAGYRRHCQACKRDHFPRVDPVVIMLIKHDGKYLLGRGPHFRPGSYSALAGFVEPGETVEAAVRRETLEETGVKVGDVRYLMSQPWPFPSTLMIGMMGEALSTKLTLDATEIEDARWFSRDEIKQMMVNRVEGELCLPPAMSIACQMLVREIAASSDNERI